MKEKLALSVAILAITGLLIACVLAYISEAQWFALHSL
jgi:hypothetical protein